MENYPSNSMKAQTDGSPEGKKTDAKAKSEKKVQQITVNAVTTRKKPLGRRIMETFGGGDAQGVGTYILNDVLLPAAKDMVADAVSQGIEKMLFGEARSSGGRRSSASRPGGSNYTSYNRFSVNPGNRREEPRRDISKRARSNHEFEEIILGSRAEASEVIDNLYNLVSEYGVATVADLYNMTGTTPAFTDEDWGWEDLRGASIRHIRNGYLLDLPRPIPID